MLESHIINHHSTSYSTPSQASPRQVALATLRHSPTPAARTGSSRVRVREEHSKSSVDSRNTFVFGTRREK